MKKIFYLILLFSLVFALSACSASYKIYAKRINKAAEKDINYTYSEIVEDLGKPTYYQKDDSFTFYEGSFGFEIFETKICVWKGQNSRKSLYVYFDGNTAVKAEVKGN